MKDYIKDTSASSIKTQAIEAYRAKLDKQAKEDEEIKVERLLEALSQLSKEFPLLTTKTGDVEYLYLNGYKFEIAGGLYTHYSISKPPYMLKWQSPNSNKVYSYIYNMADFGQALLDDEKYLKNSPVLNHADYRVYPLQFQ